MVALLVLLPLSVYALEPMDDGELDEITAQEGVMITFSGVGTTSVVATDHNGATIDLPTAFKVAHTGADSAWTNTDANGEHGILNRVSEDSQKEIFVTGDLTIQATQNGVEIGVPTVVVTTTETKTDIYIGTGNGTDSFITKGNVDVADTKLGTQYVANGATLIETGQKITISAM